MGGNEIETEVGLEVDGAPVFRAFDEIGRRVKELQSSVKDIQVKAQQAAEGFGTSLQRSLANFNKTISTLEKFQTNVQKYDPHYQAAQAAEQAAKDAEAAEKIRQQQIQKGYVQQGAVARDEAKKTAEAEKAYAKQRGDAEQQIAQQSAQLWSNNDKERRRADVERQRAQRLADQELIRQYTDDQRRAEQDRVKNAKLAEQNRIKQIRDVAQQQVAGASSRQLPALQEASSSSLTNLRAQRAGADPEEQRRLEQAIALEKERLRLVEARITAEQREKDKISNSDGRIDSALDIRSGRNSERELAAQLDLNGAKTRAADLEASVAVQIERAYNLTGKEKIEAERALKVDEARLMIAQRRATTLEGQATRQAEADRKAAVAANKPAPSTPGIFGSSGIVGVLGRTAAYGAAASVMYGTISALKDGISDAIEFQDAIAKIGGVAGLTETQETKLAASIRDVAANSRFATTEIADATMVLAQAGFSASDIGKSLQQVANLAAAAGVGMSEATDVVTSAIGAFQLQTSETGHIADVLSAALNTTKLNIQQVALGIQYAGQTAYENKISFDELTAAMATMAQAGIKSGSTIGTGLRQFLVDLQSPTKKMVDEFKKLGITMSDIDVKTQGLSGVLATLSAKGFTAADAYGSMEKRSAAMYLVLKNNQDVLNKQIVLVNQLGNSAEAAGKGSESLAAEWQRFKNILNENTADSFAPIAKGVQDMLHSFNELNGNQDLRKMRDQLDQLDEGSDAWAHQVDAIEAYKEALKQNISALSVHSQEMEKAKTAVNEANEAMSQNEQTILAEGDAIGRLVQHQNILKNDTGALAAETASLMNRFEGLASQLYGTAQSYENLLTSMRKVRAESISLGALKAGEQAMAYDQSIRAKVGQANSMGSLIMQSGLYAKMPKNMQDAAQKLRANPTGADANVLAKMLYDYAGQRGNGLQGVESDRIRGWAQTMSGIGLDASARSSARNTQVMYQGFGSQGGQAALKEVDDLTGKSDSAIKPVIARYLNNAAHAPNEGLRMAWQQMAEMAQQKLGSGELPHGPDQKAKAAKVNRLPARQDRAVDAEALKADNAQLQQALKGIGDSHGSVSSDDNSITIAGSRGLTLARLDQNLSRISNSDGNGALDQWITDRTKQVQDQLKTLKLDPNSGKGKGIMDDLQREIDAKKEETERAVGEAMAKMLGKMVDAAEAVAKRAEEAADHGMNMVQSRVTALGRASLNGKVPDYVQATVDRQAAVAKDNRDQQQIAINDAKLAKLQSAYDFGSQGMDLVKAKGLSGVDDPAIKSLTDLNDQIVALKDNNDELKASFGGDGLLPKGLNANLQMAIANYREVNHLTASWSDMISMNLTGALDSANGALTQFFSDVMSGNASITQSFASMVKTVIGFLSQLIAKMIATKILEAALNIFSGGATKTFNMGYSSADLSSFAAAAQPHLYGGQIKALSGRYITQGVPNRDSVNAKIAKGEFVQRKWAVDSVGVDFMQKLNDHGAAALQGFGPKIVMPAPAHQLTNVYVVAQEHQQSMGPNDVLVTIANDIYRGGPTKQLIKQVAQGG